MKEEQGRAMKEAVERDDAGAIILLLAAGEDPLRPFRVRPDSGSRLFFTHPGAVWYAAERGCLNALAALLAAGVSPDQPVEDGKSTPLHFAATAAQIHAVQLLLDAGGNPLAPDGFGATPLDDARRVAHHSREGEDAIRREITARVVEMMEAAAGLKKSPAEPAPAGALKIPEGALALLRRYTKSPAKLDDAFGETGGYHIWPKNPLEKWAETGRAAGGGEAFDLKRLKLL